jgi:hypothetical protein
MVNGVREVGVITQLNIDKINMDCLFPCKYINSNTTPNTSSQNCNKEKKIKYIKTYKKRINAIIKQLYNANDNANDNDQDDQEYPDILLESFFIFSNHCITYIKNKKNDDDMCKIPDSQHVMDDINSTLICEDEDANDVKNIHLFSSTRSVIELMKG